MLLAVLFFSVPEVYGVGFFLGSSVLRQSLGSNGDKWFTWEETDGTQRNNLEVRLRELSQENVALPAAETTTSTTDG